MRLSLTVTPPRPFSVGMFVRAAARRCAGLARRAWRRRAERDDVPEFEDEETPGQKQERAVREMVRRTFGDGGF